MKPYEFAMLPELQVTGIQLKIKYHDPSAAQEIGKLWQRFMQENLVEKIPFKTEPLRLIGLYTDYNPKDETCILIVGAQVIKYDATMSPEFVHRKIPSQHYAVFQGQGDPAQIVPELWQQIWQTRELQRVYSSDFEVYEKPGAVSIYVAIK